MTEIRSQRSEVNKSTALTALPFALRFVGAMLLALCAMLFALCLPAEAQQPAKIKGDV